MSRGVFGLVIVAGNAVRRPGELAIWYWSDLGVMDLWYGKGSPTLFETKHGMYGTTVVPSTIDAMLDQVAEQQGLTMPLSDLVYSNPCARPKNIAVRSGYLGVSSVQGVTAIILPSRLARTTSKYGSIALGSRCRAKPSSSIAASRDRPIPRNCRAGNSRRDIAASRFQPQLPKYAKQIAFMKAEEAKP